MSNVLLKLQIGISTRLIGVEEGCTILNLRVTGTGLSKSILIIRLFLAIAYPSFEVENYVLSMHFLSAIISLLCTSLYWHTGVKEVEKKLLQVLDYIKRNADFSAPSEYQDLAGSIGYLVLNLYNYKHFCYHLPLNGTRSISIRSQEHKISVSGTMKVDLVAFVCVGTANEREYEFAASFLNQRDSGLRDLVDISIAGQSNITNLKEDTPMNRIKSVSRIDESIAFRISSTLKAADVAGSSILINYEKSVAPNNCIYSCECIRESKLENILTWRRNLSGGIRQEIRMPK